MHYTLFGHIHFLEEEQRIQQRIEMMSFGNNDPNIQIGLGGASELCLYWVDLPGIHPIQLTHELVSRHNLWEAIIDDRRMLQEIQRMNRRRGRLNCICRTDDDLMDHFERDGQAVE